MSLQTFLDAGYLDDTFQLNGEGGEPGDGPFIKVRIQPLDVLYYIEQQTSLEASKNYGGPDGDNTVATLIDYNGEAVEINLTNLAQLMTRVLPYVRAGYEANGGLQDPLVAAYAAYSSGAAYSLTASSAGLVFGGGSLSLVLPRKGTYLIHGEVNYRFNGATFLASRNVTTKLRRTNNTAADVANSTEVVSTGETDARTATMLKLSTPQVIYTTQNDDDVLALFADVSTVPTDGSLDAASANIVAVRLSE